MSFSNLSAQETVDIKYLEKDDGLLSRVVNHVIRDNKGYFYLFFNDGIQKYDGADFYPVSVTSLLSNNVSLKDITEVSLNEAHQIEIEIDHYKGSFFIQSGDTKITYNPSAKKSESKNTYFKEKQISINNKTYIFTSSAVFTIKNNTRQFIDSIPVKETPRFLSSDKKGNIIAAYSNRDFFIDNYYVLDTFERIHKFSDVPVIYNTAKDVYADDAFYKWMVVGYNGVKIISFKRDGVTFIKKRDNVNKGEFGNVIMGLASLNNETYFNNEGLTYFKIDSTGEKSNQVLVSEGLQSEGINQLKLNPYNNLFYSRGFNNSDITDLYTIDFQKDQISSKILSGDFYDFTFINQEEILLVGQNRNTMSGQMGIYNTLSESYQSLESSLPPMRCIYFDNEKKEYWIGTTDGVFRTDQDFKISKEYSSTSALESRIDFDEVGMIVPYKNKLVMCSKGGGLYIVDPATDKIFKTINSDIGLTNNMVASAITDNHNHLWVSTFNGLNVIDSSFNIVKNIFQHHGLPNREFNTQAVTKDLDGKIYLGTLNGLCIIDPLKVMMWEENDKLDINNTTYYLDGKKVTPSTGTHQTYLDSIVIKYTVTDYFKFPYSNNQITLSSNQDVKTHQYEDKISVFGMEYGNLNLYLSPILSKRGIKHDLVLTRDYFSIFKRILWLILGILLVVLISKQYSNYLFKKESDRLALNEKISTLKLSALQGQMNPHFIFNALGSIQYFIQSNQSIEADKYLTNFSKLIRGILDSSKNRFISIEKEIELLQLYVGIEKMRFEEKFESRFIISPNLPRTIQIPPMLIQPFVENAINHGIYHLNDRDGLIEIEFKYINEDKIKVIVKDNGIGRKAALKLKKEKTHQSRGLSITNERIETINNTYNLTIKIQVNDITEDDKVAGTQVELQFLFHPVQNR